MNRVNNTLATWLVAGTMVLCGLLPGYINRSANLQTDTQRRYDMGDGVNFGYLPQVVQTSERSYSLWFLDGFGAYNPGHSILIAAPFADGGGLYLETFLTRRVGVYSNLFDVSPGGWYTGMEAYTSSEWNHLVVTYSAWSTAADPIVYINSVSAALTESLTPAGDLNSEFGAEFVIGNRHTDTKDYDMPWKGQIKEVRVYNRILTQDEVDELYNSGTPDALGGPTSGLVFQGPVIPTNMLPLYDGVTLTSKLKILDNIFGAVGTPVGTPQSSTW